VRLADFLDQSVHSVEESVQVRLRQTDSRLLKAIDAALDRVERGTFGVCEVCLQDIPTPRLNAVPWARLCRDCKEQQDTGEPRQTSLPRGPEGWAE
jgi:DnaK suppressor protein